MWDHLPAHGCGDDTHPWPPLTRGLLSVSEAGGENILSLRLLLRKIHLPHQREALACSLQHILDENAISSLRVIYQNMGNGAYQLAVLDDGRAGHECVKYRTKFFYEFFENFLDFVEIRQKFIAGESIAIFKPLTQVENEMT